MILIAPSILSANFLRLGSDIAGAENAGADLLHIDVMDGRFVPNITIGPFIVEQIRSVTRLPLDVHLMIAEPARFIHDFISAGADYITVHAEADHHLHRTIHAIREKGVKAGVSMNPATSLSCLDHIIEDLDLVLVMSVNPGFGGQDFIPFSLRKIATLRSFIDERKAGAVIEVDGGIKPGNAAEVAAAGAGILVMGSAFFHAENYPNVIKTVRDACRSVCP